MGEIADITSTVKKLNAALNRLTKSSINDQDKKTIRDFIFSIRNEKKKLQRNTLIAHTNTLKRTCEILSKMGIKKSLADIKQSDFSQFLMYLEDVKRFKQGNMNQYIKSFKRFSLWKHGDNIPLWVTKLQITKPESLIQPCDLPTREEFNRFLSLPNTLETKP
jgi:Phage integrase, N-terminal SAM-like domain.